MMQNIQYIVDDSGNKISVIVPYSDWELFNTNYHKLLNKLEVLQGIQDSMLEVKKAKKSGEKLQTLTDFLDENRG